MSQKSVLKKVGKVTLYILLGVFILLCLLLVFINIPAGKRVVRNQVQSYLQDKLKTKVVIGSIDYSLPTWLEINKVYVEDQQKDTLIYGESISVDINMIKLLRGNTDIQKLFFKNILLKVNRAGTDSNFNFQFVIDAFTGNKPTAQANPDTAELKLTLDRIIFDRVALRYKDQNAGTDFWAAIKNLDATLTKFQPDRTNFRINEFMASGVDFIMSSYKAPVVDSTGIVAIDSVQSSPYGLFISASRLNLRDVNVVVENKVTGMYYENRVTHLGLGNAKFDLDGAIATGDTLLLDSSYVRFTNPKSAPTNKIDTDTSIAATWFIKAGHVSLKDNHIRYDDENISPAGGFDVAHFNVKDLSADIASFAFTADTTSALVRQLTFRDTSGFALDTVHADFLMTDTVLSAKSLYVKTPQSLLQQSVDIRYDSIAAITTDPANTRITAVLNNSTIAFNDLYLLFPFLKTSFPPEAFANNLVQFNTELRGTMQRIYLPFLQLKALSGSTVNARGTLYNITNPNTFYYDLYIDGSSFRKSDILKFVPPENAASLANLPDIVNLSGRITGNKNDLTSDVKVSGTNMLIDGKFTMKNIADPTKLKYDFALRSSRFDKKFIMGFFPPGTLPPNFNLPQTVTAAGKFEGDANNFVADLKLGGDYGPIAVKGFMRNMQDTKNAVYDLFVEMDQFEIGKLLGQDSVLGKFTGNVTARGKGFDYKTMTADIIANVSALQYNNYNYRNAQLNAKLNNGIIESKGSVSDSSLKLNYDVIANVKSEYPTVNGMIRVDTAELNKLNLYEDTLNFSLTANIAANNLQPRNLDVNTVIDSIRLQLGTVKYALDTVALVATSEKGIDDINFHSPFADVHANGAFDYDKVGDAVINYVDHYYDIAPGKELTTTTSQQLAVDGIIKYHPLITALVPGLNKYEPITIEGKFASDKADSALNFTTAIPYLNYDGNTVRAGNISVNSSNEKLNYAITFDTLNYAKSTFFGTTINGSAANDSLNLSALTQDDNRKDWFGLGASLFVKDSVYSFRLKDSLLLNYEQWHVANDNYIRYSPAGIIIHNFDISSDTARIFINSRQETLNSPIDVNIDNFNLRSIAAIASNDTLFASGIMDAKIVVSELQKSVPAFTGDLTISGLEIMQQPLGDVTAFAEKQSDNNITGRLTLLGHGNNVEASGNYYLNNVEKEFDALLKVNSLSMRTLEGLSAGGIRNASGSVHGSIDVNGKFADPAWQGELVFDTARFSIAQMNAPVKINDEKISFNSPNITFDDFTILDSLDHQMLVNGSVTVNKDNSLGLGLGISASEFILLNASRAISNELYGFASADINIAVTGTSVAPKIEGDIFVNEKSDVTIVIPEQSYSKDAARTIVRFIDTDTFNFNPPVAYFVPEQEEQSAFAQFLQYNLNIEINKYSALKIVIDPVTGDEIQVRGDAQLNAGVDPGGNIILAGNYVLDKGYYVFNYQFLQRRFELQKGSTILFAGEPMQARIDIAAAYEVNTSAKDLLYNEVSGLDPLTANSFNQKIPFNLMLYLTGVLSRPTIKFDIQLNEENLTINSDVKSTIENKLSQLRGDEAATNKQVFSLLLLGRFVGEQSSDFFKGNGNEFNDLARQSVSQFLSSALNEIAGNLFKGIDVDLNLNSYRDYNEGGSSERTDLNVVVSKTFLDDRLTVSVGKNFGVQGNDPASKAGNDNFIPDVTLGYKLSKDGKYMLRAYRRNQFEVVVDGYVVETGLGFVVTMDYEKFNELFARKTKK